MLQVGVHISRDPLFQDPARGPVADGDSTIAQDRPWIACRACIGALFLMVGKQNCRGAMSAAALCMTYVLPTSDGAFAAGFARRTDSQVGCFNPGGKD